MTATTDTLNLRDAVALGTILRAAQSNAAVSWLSDDSGALISGTARHIVRDPETAYFLHDDEDVRDAYLRISATFEYFLPVRRLIEKVHTGEFVIEQTEG